MVKSLSILGSTGSIGTSTLQIVAAFEDRFSVKALAAHTNVDTLADQINQFKPDVAVVKDQDTADRLNEKLPVNSGVKILHGSEGYQEAAAHDGVDLVVGAMVGAAGLLPTLAAIEAGKNVALANKETLVMAGALVISAAASKGIRIFPVDSEHSAIFQCLSGNRRQDLQKILLTASGGPFRELSPDGFDSITPADALNHPNWSMGNKITIDSATLMNKGLEVIEARWLFDVPYEKIEVVVHPQSIVHSMVAYKDGSVIAQMGVPDMKGAIAYALSFPERLELGQPIPDFNTISNLTFEAPDLSRFPCLKLAFEAGTCGGTLPAVMNAANEVAVGAFLEGRIAFTTIAQVIRETMKSHCKCENPDLRAIIDADLWARNKAESWVDAYK